jgi:hypothetical protein
MFVRVARLVPATGILFAIFVVLATVLTSDAPGGDSSTQEIAEYYADDDATRREVASMFLIGLAAFCFLSFLGSLRGALVSAEGEPARLTTAATAAGATFIALAVAAHAVGTAVAGATQYFDDFQADPQTIRIFMAASFAFFVLSLFAAAAMTAAASVLALYSEALPRWLAWLGLLATLGGLTSFLVWPSLVVLAWIVAASAWLLRPVRALPPAPP